MANATSAVKKRRNRTIVVVGNNTPALLSVTLLLQRFEYEVALAHTATQALERVSAVRPVLIISDVVLPGMSSTELFHHLKQDRATTSIPVLFMVPGSDASAEVRCLDLGAAGCIGKPVQAEELYRVVQEVVEPIPRASIRINARLPVSVNNVPLDSGRGECEVHLSERGMYVPMSKPYPANRRITVTIDIKDRTISAEGSVVYCQPTDAGLYREPGMGLKFVDIAPQDQALIRKFIRKEVTRDITGALSPAPADVW